MANKEDPASINKINNTVALLWNVVDLITLPLLMVLHYLMLSRHSMVLDCN